MAVDGVKSRIQRVFRQVRCCLHVTWVVLTYERLDQDHVNDLNNRVKEFFFGTVAMFLGLIALEIPVDQVVLTSVVLATILFLASYLLSEHARMLVAYYGAGMLYLLGLGLVVGAIAVLGADFLAGTAVLVIYGIAAGILLILGWNKIWSMWGLAKLVKQSVRRGLQPGDG